MTKAFEGKSDLNLASVEDVSMFSADRIASFSERATGDVKPLSVSAIGWFDPREKGLIPPKNLSTETKKYHPIKSMSVGGFLGLMSSLALFSIFLELGIAISVFILIPIPIGMIAGLLAYKRYGQEKTKDL